MDIPFAFLVLGAGYVLGSISFAVIISRLKGVDIFKAGSGNPGATNVLRTLGKGPGYTVFFLDFLKGFVAAGWPSLVFTGESGLQLLYPILGLTGAILGHSFSVFLKLRGGKGVATAIGGLLAMEPYVILIGVIVWVVTFYSTRYVSLASILLGLSLPISAWFFQDHIGEFYFNLALGILIVARHHANIVRLIKGEENRFTRK